MKLSIVATLYNSAPHLEEFCERISRSAVTITKDYEIILVNDGSPDNSLDLALSLNEKDDRIKIVDLSRNFGHHKAIMTGLSFARGDWVFLIDSDLEEPPKLLETFWEAHQNLPDADVIYGVQGSRKGGWFEKISGNLFYGMINFLSDVKIPRNFLTVRLMAQKYTENLVRFREREINFSTLAELTGFKQTPLVVQKASHSPSTYTFLKKFGILVNALTSSTNRPLWLIFYMGLIITLASTGFVIKLFIDKLIYGIGFQGWTSLMVAIFFFGGLMIFFLGIIGVYLSKIFIESKSRPYTIIKSLYGIHLKE